MAARHSKQAGLIPAAAYLRMSSDKQETSIADQRTELLAYAAKEGFTIVKRYIDEGVSGWKGKQRHAFQSLIADAQGGEFKAVLCWDQSRFSRFDPMEANYYWHILRTEGVFIETVKEGRLDFETLGGWLSASVHQHGKAEYVKSLAADIVRGKRKKVLDGKWLFTTPYGYRSENGKLTLGDAAEIEVVRRIFQMRAAGTGRRAICITLNSEGIASPRGMAWTPKQISKMLTRQTYIGHMVAGENPTGKLSHIVDEVRVFENTHPAIIDRDLWDKVQAVNGRKRTRHHSRGHVGSHLSGLLKCGCCHSTMISDSSRSRYICGSYHLGNGCTFNVVTFEAALKAVADKIRSLLLMGSLDSLTTAIERVLAKRRESTARTDVDALKRQIAEIDRKLEGAAARILEVELSLVKDVQSAMLALKASRAALEERMEAEVVAARRKPLTARQIAEKVWELDEVLRSGSPGTVREALSQIIDRVQIDYTVLPRGKTRKRAVIAGGTIFFSSKGDTPSKPSRSIRSTAAGSRQKSSTARSSRMCSESLVPVSGIMPTSRAKRNMICAAVRPDCLASRDSSVLASTCRFAVNSENP